MGKIISKIAALGIPGLVLLIALNATGFAGAAALTTALAALGPGGMIGGLATLGVLGLMSEAITKYGFDSIYKGVIKELYKKGESIDSIKEKIDAYPISKEMKLKLNNQIDELSKCEEK